VTRVSEGLPELLGPIQGARNRDAILGTIRTDRQSSGRLYTNLQRRLRNSEGRRYARKTGSSIASKSWYITTTLGGGNSRMLAEMACYYITVV